MGPFELKRKIIKNNNKYHPKDIIANDTETFELLLDLLNQ